MPDPFRGNYGANSRLRKSALRQDHEGNHVRSTLDQPAALRFTSFFPLSTRTYVTEVDEIFYEDTTLACSRESCLSD